MPRIHRYVVVPAVSLLIFAVAACGGDDAPTATPVDDVTSAVTTEPAPAPAEPVDVCAAVTTIEISSIVGADVTAEEIIGGGCNFKQEDPRALSVSIVPAVYDEANGGLEAAKLGTAAIIDGDIEDLQIGEGAFIVVGTALGGENQQGQGAVHVSGQLLTIAATQGVGMSADDVGATVVALMQLTVSKV